MPNTGQDQDAAEILGILRAYHAAMVEARIDQLGELVDEDYSLVHITGYVQPKDEWFDVIRTGQFDYHKIDIDDRVLSVSVSGDTATVAGRGIFDATINGMHAPWRLQFKMTWSRQRGEWRIVSARYSSF
jgi:ketosteroid isomerase-like protein